MLGDGIWERMRLQEGVWYCFGEHLGRFSNSCKAISLDVGMDKVGIAEAMRQTAEVSDVRRRLMLTHVVKDKPFKNPQFSTSGPTLVIIVEQSKPVDRLQSAGVYAAGARVAAQPKPQAQFALQAELHHRRFAGRGGGGG